jgi:hypothetical protein
MAPETGIYEVRHYQHRFSHEATILVREVFPVCRYCGQRASFRLVRSADRLRSDIDFKKHSQRPDSKTA